MHQITVIIHVFAGLLAIVTGFFILVASKSGASHIRRGRIYLRLLTIVIISGFLGWLFFRSDPFLFLLTLLAGYNGFSGWRVVRSRHTGASFSDFAIALATLVSSIFYIFFLHMGDAGWNSGVIYATLGGLVLITSYDISKFLWFRRSSKKWWVYEHIYKMISTFSALLSAFTGNILRSYQPLSQILPNILCILLIFIFILKEVRKRNKHAIKELA